MVPGLWFVCYNKEIDSSMGPAPIFRFNLARYGLFSRARPPSETAMCSKINRRTPE